MRRNIAARAMVIVIASAFMNIMPPALTSAQEATPQAIAPAAISSEVLARAVPEMVVDPELALGRVTIMPGATIPRHHHVGTQIAVIVQGVLTYKVFTGEILLFRGDDPAGEPYVIGAGETVSIGPGDAVVESPGALHQAKNLGATPITIYLSTLFPVGAPRSVIDEATPTP